MRGHFGALRLPPAGSWPSHTARTEVRPCSTMPARAANNPALIPTARHAPESISDSKSETRVGSRLRADSASDEDGHHGCSGWARPSRPRTGLQLVLESASGPHAKSGLRAQGAKQGAGSVAGSRGGAGRARGHPHIRKPAPILPYPCFLILTGHPVDKGATLRAARRAVLVALSDQSDGLHLD